MCTVFQLDFMIVENYMDTRHSRLRFLKPQSSQERKTMRSRPKVPHRHLVSPRGSRGPAHLVTRETAHPPHTALYV